MDYVFRRLALDHLPYETRAELSILSAAERAAQLAGEDPGSITEDMDPVEMAQSAPRERPQPDRSGSTERPAGQEVSGRAGQPAQPSQQARPVEQERSPRNGQ